MADRFSDKKIRNGKNMLKKKILKFYLICMLLSPVFGMAENTTTQQGPAVFLPEEVV
jgi:hypothetical protein